VQGWTHIETIGVNIVVYGQGDKRRIVDRKTDKVIYEFTLKRRPINEVPTTH